MERLIYAGDVAPRLASPFTVRAATTPSRGNHRRCFTKIRLRNVPIDFARLEMSPGYGDTCTGKLTHAARRFSHSGLRGVSLHHRKSSVSAFHFISDRLQFCPHAISMRALDFQSVIRDCPACSTCILQEFQERWQVGVLRRQPANHGHHATVFAFLDGNPGCLLSGWSTNWCQWRTGTLRFRFFTPITMRWSIEFCACQ